MALPKLVRKPQTRKKGLKVLVYGEAGTGKTMFALSFPQSIALDSEDGYAWYEGTEKGKNLLGIIDSQSFTTLEKLLKDLRKATLDDMSTFIIDSETKIYENIQEALQSVEENRARIKGRDVLDANLSQRSWGKIKQLATRLQNMKIVLSTKGFNVISVAQSKDITEDIGNGNRVKVDEDANMSKNAKFDYDLVLRLYNDENGKYMGEIIKDRTNVTSKGDKIENPSYEIWKDVLEGSLNQGDVVEKDFTTDIDKSKAAYEADVEKNLPLKDRVKKHLMSLSKDQQTEFLKQMVEIGEGKKDPDNYTKEQQEQVVKLMTK